MADGKTININFPFQDSSKGYYLDMTETSRDAVRSNLLHLLLTNKGERLYLPDFGSDLKKYIFEPNDKITRDEVKQAVESLLLELVGLRAIYDFAVVCDETNNTPARVDRNELYVDIAIEPVKAIEFIYIPLRVKNTGEI